MATAQTLKDNEMIEDIVLETKDLTKSFPGVVALDHVSIYVKKNEVLGLVGENGAGKSTLLKIIAGLYPQDHGTIILRGKEIFYKNISEASNLSIGMVFQEQSLIPNITVAENIYLGNESRFVNNGIYDWKELYTQAAFQLKKLNAQISPKTITGELSFAQRQLVEMARVLSTEERTQHQPIILLDEPTSVLEGNELEEVLNLVRALKNHGSVIFVSHRLEEVLRVSDRIYVMTNGSCVAECDPKNINAGDLEKLMLGSELTKEYHANTNNKQERDKNIILSVDNLSQTGSFENISFDLYEGEVLGIAGVVGSGRENLCRALFGAGIINSGKVTLEGEEVSFRMPDEAVKRGIGYIPSERRTEGIVAGMSVKENITLTHIKTVQNGYFINGKKETNIVNSWVTKLKIKTPSIKSLAGQMSGGNQQKIVLAKWLIAHQPKVLIMDHPMRGLDVGAKAEVFEIIRKLSRDGIGIILIADTLEELLALGHQIIVMRDGVITARFDALSKKPKKLEILERMI